MPQYKDIIIPSGSIFNNATIKGFGAVVFKDTPHNQFDNGLRYAQNEEYKILSIVDRSKEDTSPFVQPMNISGFSVKIGTVVNIQLTKNVTATIPTELIIMSDNEGSTNRGNSQTGSQSFLTTKNIIIGILAIGVIVSGLKLTKVL